MRKILTALLASIALFGASVSAQTLLINSFGGSYEEAHRQCIIDPFEAATGATVEIVTAYSADALAQLRAQASNPQFDVMHFSGGQEVIAAAEGLLAPIQPEELSNYGDVYPFAVAGITEGIGPVYQLAAIGILYNTDEVESAPTSWNDLFDPQFADGVVLADISNTYGLLSLLMLNQVRGGTMDDIQPGLDAVAELLDNGATVVSSSPEILQAFSQAGALVAPYAQDYAHVLREAGVPVAFALPAEGAPAVYITANVVAGRPNTDLAKQFVDYSLRADAQACFAEALRYSPTNAQAEIAPELEGLVLVGEDQISALVAFDPEQIAERRSAWTDAWNRVIAR